MKLYHDDELPPIRREEYRLSGKDIGRILLGFAAAYLALSFFIIVLGG